MVYRVYVEKKPLLRQEARAIRNELNELLGAELIRELRLLNRYDVENIAAELFASCIPTVFAELQTDDYYRALPEDGADLALAVEYLPGQFDQRADSAAQCVQLISQQERPLVRTARVYLIYGQLDAEQAEAIRRYLINPVESCAAQLDEYATLAREYPEPADIPLLAGFSGCDDNALRQYIRDYGLAMDLADLVCCRDYFVSERRDPTLTELKVIDTYWSDHCRHTTFGTRFSSLTSEDEDVQAAWDRYQKTRRELGRGTPETLMDIATVAMRYLKAQGRLPRLDQSAEINACTVKIEVEINGENQPWLLLFKNETHNHPTEIEPFGGAATCIGGAIRDPLSGRAYVYQAMRLTGAADPLTPLSATLPGKLPQRKIVIAAANGYSSYGNQIGLATGLVDEVYHPGYLAKRLEVGAVVGAAPEANVRRLTPEAGDLVLLLGGRTGRDGCGGATGSSKAHDSSSLATCGAEVQKGNAPEERKLQRLFRNPEASTLIKRCNDFGAGGVSVAIGELAEGVEIDLDAVPKKYAGLDGTELAISESQERMAVVVDPAGAERLIALAAAENLEATAVARVTKQRRLTMRWRGQKIVDLARDFLDSNGAAKQAAIHIPRRRFAAETKAEGFAAAYRALAGDLNVCSKRGLAERFDSTIGAGTLLMPFGGKYQLTPTQAMAARLPVLGGVTPTCSVMSWGFDPQLSEESPFHAAYLAVVSSLAKLVASGAPLDNAYLSLQEFFPRLGTDPLRWGSPVAALLGAFSAQMDLGIAAIGGKDSMSGSFEQLDVPPTLISFAVGVGREERLLSPEFKAAGHQAVLLRPRILDNGLPDAEDLRRVWREAEELISAGRVAAAYTPAQGGIAAAVLKMCLGNRLGFRFDDNFPAAQIFNRCPAAFILELNDGPPVGVPLGAITDEPTISFQEETLPLEEMQAIYEEKLERVFLSSAAQEHGYIPTISYTASSWPRPRAKAAVPRFLIPVFPGTNCEYDTAAAIEQAGGQAEIVVIRNLTPRAVAEAAARLAEAISRAQAVVIPGGFSGGDEPDGSGKFITAFFRNPMISEQVAELLETRDGLMLGICNGFQALIKLGLVPFGRIVAATESSPTLTFNTIGRHQSRLVRTKIASNKSPWLARTAPGKIYTVPVSHGEGRLICGEELLDKLMANGQIAAQYVDLAGSPTMDVLYNPNGSVLAVEALTSPDGRVLGKMGHTERARGGLYRNVPGNFGLPLFAAAVEYFSL